MHLGGAFNLDAFFSLVLRGLKSVGLLVLIAGVTWIASGSVGAKFALLVTAAIWVAIAASGHVAAELARRCTAQVSQHERFRQAVSAVLSILVSAAVLAAIVGFLLPVDLNWEVLALFVAFAAIQAVQNTLADIVRLATESPKSAFFSGWLAPYVSAATILGCSKVIEVSLEEVLIISTVVASFGIAVPLVRLRMMDVVGDRLVARDAMSYALSVRNNAGLTLMSAAIPAAPVIFGRMGASASEEYAMAQRLVAPVLLPAWAMASAALPRIANAAARRNDGELHELVSRNAILGGAGACFIAGAIWLWSSELLFLLGGRNVEEAIWALRWLLCGSVVYATGYAAFQSSYQIADVRKWLTLLVLVVIGTLALSLHFVSTAPLASLLVSLAQTVVLGCAIWRSRREARAVS